MRQWQHGGPMFAPAFDDIRQRHTARFRHVPGLRMLADHQRQFDGGHAREQFIPPRGGALGARRQIAGVTGTGITKSHRQDCNPRGVVERRPIDTQPLAQSIAARIVEWHAAFVNFPAGCLARNQDPCTGIDLHYGSRAMRQRRDANFARANFLQQSDGLSIRRKFGVAHATIFSARNRVSSSWHSVKPQTPRKAGCRMGGAQRYPSSLRAAMMGIAALHPSYGRDVGA